MKKLLALLLALTLVLGLAACADSEPQRDTKPNAPATDAPTSGKTDTQAPTEPELKDYSDYTIRIYSNSNSTERTTWLINEMAHQRGKGCRIHHFH